MATTSAGRSTLDARRCAPRAEGKDLTRRQASRLVGLFRLLSGETRLRLLHRLVRDGERSVSELADAVGISVQGVSNQLSRMIALGVVETRREGVRIFYRVVDPCIPNLLDSGLCLVHAAPVGAGASWLEASSSVTPKLAPNESGRPVVKTRLLPIHT